MSKIEDRKTPNEANDPDPTPGVEGYFEDTDLPTEEMTYQREGLPTDYRMRHDEHYVDELVAAGSMPQLRLVPTTEIEGATTSAASLTGLIDSIQAYGVLQPLLVRRRHGRYELLAGAKRLAAAMDVGLKEVPCLVHEVDDVDARRLAEAANRRSARAPAAPVEPSLSGSASALLEDSLHAIVSTLSLLEQPDRPLRDHVALGLIRAEATKSERLLQGLQLLAADPPLHRQSVDLIRVLTDVISAAEDERNLLGVHLESSMPTGCIVQADEALLRIALSGAVETIVSVVSVRRGTAFSVRVSCDELGSEAVVSIEEDSVRMPTTTWSRWFDLGWRERPGGYGAAVALLSAKRTAELHGARLQVAPTRSGGCQITIRWPMGAQPRA